MPNLQDNHRHLLFTYAKLKIKQLFSWQARINKGSTRASNQEFRSEFFFHRETFVFACSTTRLSQTPFPLSNLNTRATITTLLFTLYAQSINYCASNLTCTEPPVTSEPQDNPNYHRLNPYTIGKRTVYIHLQFHTNLHWDIQTESRTCARQSIPSMTATTPSKTHVAASTSYNSNDAKPVQFVSAQKSHCECGAWTNVQRVWG